MSLIAIACGLLGSGSTGCSAKAGDSASCPTCQADGGSTAESGAGAADAADANPTAADGGPAEGGPTPTLSFAPTNLSFGSETIGMTTATLLITATNSGAGPLTLNSVAMTTGNAADFTETNDCPAPLAVGEACHMRIVFSPSAVGMRTASVTVNGSLSASVSGNGTALANAFYVATATNGGSDSNAGTLAAPFLTLTKAQPAMRASGGATLTTYLRAGTYSPARLSGCLNNPCGLILNASDSNETWAFYPPDGVDSAILDGQATKLVRPSSIGGKTTRSAHERLYVASRVPLPPPARSRLCGGGGTAHAAVRDLPIVSKMFSKNWVEGRGMAGTRGDFRSDEIPCDPRTITTKNKQHRLIMKCCRLGFETSRAYNTSQLKTQ